MIELGCVLRERRHRQNRLAGIVNRLCGEGADGAGGKGILNLTENKHAGSFQKLAFAQYRASIAYEVYLS